MENKYYIGGDLIYDKSVLFKRSNNFKIKNKNINYLYNGRSAFNRIIKSLNNNNSNNILIPSYLCGDVLISILKKLKYNYYIYNLDISLNCEYESIVKLIDQDTTAILLINYFGLVNNYRFAEKIKKKFKNIKIIYDVVQNPWFFFNLTAKPLTIKQQFDYVDFAFTSFKKSYPISEGSLLYSKKLIDFKKLTRNNCAFKTWKSASLLKKKFLLERNNNLLEKKYLNYFKKIDSKNNINNYNISHESFIILNRLNLFKIAKIRIANYRFLYSALKKQKKIGILKLEKNKIPMFFPIFIISGNRDYIIKKLKKNKIFCPVHWKLNNSLRSLISISNAKIYDTEISIPIDHRISKENLQTILYELNKILDN